MASFEDGFTFVITSLEEVEDEFMSTRCLWPSEVNPFRLRKQRETATSTNGRKYHVNGGWQAWLMGR